MSYDAESLARLLPAIHRLRDAELAATLPDPLTAKEAAERDELAALPHPTPIQRERLEDLQARSSGPLLALLRAFAYEWQGLEENLAQLYDDLFIETCADWVIPYIGDLIGYEPLLPLADEARGLARSEVAHTIALRRRKGTAPVLEQLALDVTNWPARAVEYYQRLGATQCLNHLRPAVRQTPDLRKGGALEWIGTPFEAAQRTVDVRRIATGRGRHNLGNVGVHLWRLEACPRTAVTCFRVDAGRYRADPLGRDVPLFQRPLDRGDTITTLAEPLNIPLPISRRYLKENLERLYGDGPESSLHLKVNGLAIDRKSIHVCHLGDHGTGWGHTPSEAGRYAIDPLLGRIALPPEVANLDTPAKPALVELTWRQGFSAGADLGGGEYQRSFLPGPPEGKPPVKVPKDQPTLAEALKALGNESADGAHGIVEIVGNATLVVDTPLTVHVKAGGRVEIRAASGFRPVLRLKALNLSGGKGSHCVLDGLVLHGAPMEVNAASELEQLVLRHCTLVPPDQPLKAGGSSFADASLIVHVPASPKPAALQRLELERSILGGIRAPGSVQLSATACLIDAGGAEGLALAGEDPPAGQKNPSAGAVLSLQGCTVVGRLVTAAVGLIGDSLLLGTAQAERRQVGCVRFSWIAPGSKLPAGYRCQPEAATTSPASVPSFTSLRYGTPGYGQLAGTTPGTIATGASDEGEMGVFHHLQAPQRESNLRVRLAEYLRVGLNAGLFHES